MNTQVWYYRRNSCIWRKKWWMESPVQSKNRLHSYFSMSSVLQTQPRALRTSHIFYYLASAIWLNCGVFKALHLPSSGVLFHTTHEQDLSGSLYTHFWPFPKFQEKKAWVLWYALAKPQARRQSDQGTVGMQV